MVHLRHKDLVRPFGHAFLVPLTNLLTRRFTLKNKDLFVLSQGIKSTGELTGVKFAYALAVNLKKVDEEIEALQAGIKPTEEVAAFETARIALCEEHSKKDDDGKAIVEDGSFVIGDVLTFNTALTSLREHHSEALEAQVTAQEEYKVLLEEDSSIVLIKVSLDDFPEEISAAQMSQLMEMVKVED